MDKRNEVPKHLRHIDKADSKTKKVLSDLGGDEIVKKKSLNRTVTKDKSASGRDAIKFEVELLHKELDQPWCKLREITKINIKRQVALLRRKDVGVCLNFVRTELRKLELEKQKFLKQQEEKKSLDNKNKIINKKITLVEKMQFWWYRIINSKYYKGNQINFKALDLIENKFREKYQEIASIINHIVYNRWQSDFFSNSDNHKCFFETYNFLYEFSAEKMGLVIANKGVSKIKSYKKKEELLRPFMEIYFNLISLGSEKLEFYIKDIEKLGFILNHREELNPISRENLLISKSSIDILIKNLRIMLDFEKTDHSMTESIIAFYSIVFGYPTNINEIMTYLNVNFIITTDYLNIPQKSTEEYRKKKKQVEYEINKNKLALNKISEIESLVELGYKYQNYLFEQYEDPYLKNDPIAAINQIVNNFLNIFEDYISGKKQVELKDNQQAFYPLLKNKIDIDNFNFLIKPEFVGKIKIDLGDKVKNYIEELFTETSRLYQLNLKYVKPIQDSNAKIYFKTMRLFEDEIYKFSQSNFVLLNKKIKNETVLDFTSSIYELSEKVELDNGETYGGVFQIINKIGKPVYFGKDSFFSLLKCGQMIMTHLSFLLQEKKLVELLKSKKMKKTNLDSLEEKLDQFNPIEENIDESGNG